MRYFGWGFWCPWYLESVSRGQRLVPFCPTLSLTGRKGHDQMRARMGLSNVYRPSRTQPHPPEAQNLASPTSALALAPGHSLTHHWVGTAWRPARSWPWPPADRHQSPDHCSPTACQARTQPTHQQARTSPGTTWDPPLPTSGPTPALGNLEPLSQPPWDTSALDTMDPKVSCVGNQPCPPVGLAPTLGPL